MIAEGSVQKECYIEAITDSEFRNECRNSSGVVSENEADGFTLEGTESSTCMTRSRTRRDILGK